MKRLAREFLLAVRQFTRIPVTDPLAQWAGSAPLSVRASAAHFPGVGIVVGMAASVAFAVMSLLLPDAPMAALAAAIACTAATVLLTGALHERGLTGLANGLCGSADGAGALAFVKDSRVGPPAAIALVLAIGMKTALLATIASQSPAGVLAALVAAHAVSRFWPLLAVDSLHYVGDPEASSVKPFVDHVDRRLVRVGAMWCIAPLALLFATGRTAFVLWPLAASAAAYWGMRRLLLRRLQGYTGDALGATQQACEIAFYLGAAIGIGGGR